MSQEQIKITKLIKLQIAEATKIYFCNAGTKMLNVTKFHHDNFNIQINKVNNNTNYFFSQLTKKNS